MPQRFQFDASILNSVVGGHSAIDIPRLNIQTLEAASAFLHSYGFDIANEAHLEELWYYHRRALVLMLEKLDVNDEDIPKEFLDQKSLGDIRKLLLYASSSATEECQHQRWACAILRCMHVFVHAENDLFGSFAEEIQAQILTPFQDNIRHDGTTHSIHLHSADANLKDIQLKAFEIKPMKTSSSTVIKLLAKPDALAMRIFDKLGVRFVTNNLFDSFQVVRFLIRENVISFPHIMPDQSSNNLYPLDLFMEVCTELVQEVDQLTDDLIQKRFDEKLANLGDQAKFLRKENFFSGSDYRFIKFIARKLIRVKTPGQGEFSFFYPYEVQIMDQSAHERVLSGPSEHQAYKERQRAAARKRLFPE